MQIFHLGFVAEDYIETPVGSQDQHKFAKHASQGVDFDSLHRVATGDGKLQYCHKAPISPILY